MKATVIALSDTTRKIFSKMNFPEIPEEAKYIAFTEDGNCVFLSELKHEPGTLTLPKLASMLYYDVERLDVTE